MSNGVDIPGFKFGGWKGFFSAYSRLLDGRKGTQVSRPLSGFLGPGTHKVKIEEVRAFNNRLVVQFTNGVSRHSQTYWPTAFTGGLNWNFLYLLKAADIDPATADLFVKTADLGLFVKGLVGKEMSIELSYGKNVYLTEGNGLGSYRLKRPDGSLIDENWYSSLTGAEVRAEEDLKLKKARLEVRKISKA